MTFGKLDNINHHHLESWSWKSWILKKLVDEKNKQINNIYEILETLTNESKAKFKNLNESNNV